MGSSSSCPAIWDAPRGLPKGAITFKGTAGFFADEATKAWFYPALAAKVNPDSAEQQAFFNTLLDSPLRTILAITPVKRIMHNASLANRHLAGAASDDELGPRLGSDGERMNRLRQDRGLEPR